MFWILRRTGAANFFTSINNNYSSKSNANNNNNSGELHFNNQQSKYRTQILIGSFSFCFVLFCFGCAVFHFFQFARISFILVWQSCLCVSTMRFPRADHKYNNMRESWQCAVRHFYAPKLWYNDKQPHINISSDQIYRSKRFSFFVFYFFFVAFCLVRFRHSGVFDSTGM